jgi:alternative squalene epoxidase
MITYDNAIRHCTQTNAMPQNKTQALSTPQPEHISESSSTRSDEETTITSSRKTTLWNTSLAWSVALVWPCMLALPLALTSAYSPLHYTRIFRPEWYEYDGKPKPLGLSLGIAAVAVGQVFVLILFYLYKFGYLGGEPLSIQSKGSRKYEFMEGLKTHISQPEGFAVLAGYLAITWMLNLMPKSYYSFEGGIQWKETALCLVIQDGIQFVMHRLEHDVSAAFYQMSHKPHHRFINPRLFDAFNGSLADTLCMIILPLFITANIVRTANVWSYMAFGSSYASWLTLIHSEYLFPWDPLFRRLGLGTPGDHHVHHAFFKYNFGHLFMWFDQLCGTYCDPKEFAPKAFHVGA